MATTKAQIEASRRYNKKYLKYVQLGLNKRTETDIIAWLDNQPSKAGAIKALIRERIARQDGWNNG